MFYLLRKLYLSRTTFLLVSSFLISSVCHAQEIFKPETIEQIDTIAHHIDQAKKLFNELNNHTHLVDKRSHRSKENKTTDELSINASHITTPKQKYIVTQAPRKKTTKNFWKLVLDRNCKLILTLCMPLENHHERCAPYWKKPFYPKKMMDWKISFLDETIVLEGPSPHRIVERRFLVRNTKTRDERTIVQLHYENWPNYGVPDLSLFQTYLDLVDENSAHSSSPILVHCVAGIGRSGTLVAAHSLRKELLAGKTEISIPQRICELRKQRRSLVTTPKQFQCIYQTLLPFFK